MEPSRHQRQVLWRNKKGRFEIGLGMIRSEVGSKSLFCDTAAMQCQEDQAEAADSERRGFGHYYAQIFILAD
jgi:hypothetical protein